MPTAQNVAWMALDWPKCRTVRWWRLYRQSCKIGWHCQVVQSTDRGHSWQPVSKLPYHSAVPWEYQGVLYLFTHPLGTRFRNDDLLLLRSDDAGKTWSELVTLFEGHFWNCQTGMVIHDNRLY